MTANPKAKAARILRAGIMRAFREGRKVYSPSGLPCTWEPRVTVRHDPYPLLQSNGIRIRITGCTFEPPVLPQAAPAPPDAAPKPVTSGRTFKVPPRLGRVWDHETIDTVMLCEMHVDGKEWLPVTVTVNGVGELEIFSVPRSEET